MIKVLRPSINWELTGEKIKELRNGNIHLRRFICNNLLPYRSDKFDCDGIDCENCESDIDPSISRRELASVFGVSESLVENWEYGRTPVKIEDLLYFAKICHVGLFDILVVE